MYPIGLRKYNDIINENTEKDLLSEIDSYQWSNKLKRRTQQYGYTYDYTSSNIVEKAPEFPKLIDAIANYLTELKIFEIKPNQCIINEYLRNQGINPHIDKNIFGNTIVSISLLEDTIMKFTRENEVVPVFLPRRSMIILQNSARYDYKHSIESKVSYNLDDKKIIKSKDYRRISITFRNFSE